MTELFKVPRTGPEHYVEAQRLLSMSWEDDRTPENVGQILACAQVHATLALAAATGLNDADCGMPLSDSYEWAHVAGVNASAEPVTS